MYYFRIQAGLRTFTFSTTFALKSCDFRAGAAKVYFVYYLCDECSENSPAKVPRWGPRKLFFSREDGGFRNKEFQTTVIWQVAESGAQLHIGQRDVCQQHGAYLASSRCANGSSHAVQGAGV